MTAKEKVQSLIASANETTGGSDDNLTDAVGTLIDGYGQGGEVWSEITITEDTVHIDEALVIFQAMIPSNKLGFSAKYIGSTPPVQDKIMFVSGFHTGVSASWARWRNGVVWQSATGSTYLGNVNVGDKYEIMFWGER